MAPLRLLVIAIPLVALVHGPARADDGPPQPQSTPVYPAPPSQTAQPQPTLVYPAPPAQTAQPQPQPQPTLVYPAQIVQPTYVPQGVAMSGPEEISDFDFNRPVPSGYTSVERTRRGLIVGGAVTFGVAYIVSSLVAAAGEDDASLSSPSLLQTGGDNKFAALWIPVVGPFIAMTQADRATDRFTLAGLGGAQLAGAIMLGFGLASKEHVLVRNDLVGGVAVTPMAGPGGSGLALSGRF